MLFGPPRAPCRLSPLRLWAPPLFWLLVIFALSAYPRALIPQGKYFSWDKLAHLAEYGVAGYLIARALFFSGKPFLRRHYAWITILSGLAYAISDEAHQYFVGGRNASTYDVVADLIGVILGRWLFALLLFRQAAKRTVDQPSSGRGLTKKV
ncbi:MAG: VanZ family protein [Candidatus Zixiibacteriota bacterium]|nr:MAG: VanZ family protein [candidate division Zixibacteria bacterium]